MTNRKSFKPPTQERIDNFQGYQALPDVWARLPINLIHDHALSRDELLDMLLIGAEIGYRQFQGRVDRFTPVPISWPDVATALRMSIPSAEVHIAVLETRCRLLVHQGESFLGRNGGTLRGSNRYCLRWVDNPPTNHLHAVLARRAVAISRRAASHAKSAAQSLRSNLTDEGRLSSVNPTQESPCLDPVDPICSPADPTCLGSVDGSELQEKQVHGIVPSSSESNCATVSPSVPDAKQTDGLTDDVLHRLRTALGRVLDPPQVTRAMKFPVWGPEETWWLLEAVRIHGSWAKVPAKILYPALIQDTTRATGQGYLDKIAAQTAVGNWVALPTDGTPLEDADRTTARKHLGSLQRLPLSVEGEVERQRIMASHKTVLPPPSHGSKSVSDLLATQDGRANCLSLLGYVRSWQETTRAFMKDWENEALSKASQEAQDSLQQRLKGIGPIRLLSSARVDHDSMNLWALLGKEIQNLLDQPDCPF